MSILHHNFWLYENEFLQKLKEKEFDLNVGIFKTQQGMFYYLRVRAQSYSKRQICVCPIPKQQLLG